MPPNIRCVSTFRINGMLIVCPITYRISEAAEQAERWCLG
nr:MAG TPA: hypothetical protein [Caudoviricetes sp.]